MLVFKRDDKLCNTNDDDNCIGDDLINNKFTFPRQKWIQKVKFNILGSNFTDYYGRSNTGKN